MTQHSRLIIISLNTIMLGLSDNSLLNIWKEAVRFPQQETDSHPKGPGNLGQLTFSRLQTEHRTNSTKSKAMPDMLMLVACLFYLAYASEKEKTQTDQLTCRERDCTYTTSELPTGTAMVQGCKTK
jgi:hypothetical protein